MIRHYTLDAAGNPVQCDDLLEWAQWMQDAERTVALTHFGDGSIDVSTVFLGLDHSFGRAAPVLWETMVFVKEGVTIEGIAGYMDRYTSREDALQGHAAICAYVQRAIDARRAAVLVREQ